MSGWMSDNMNLRRHESVIAWMHHWEVSDCMNVWLHKCITGRCLTAWMHDCINASLGGVWLHECMFKAWVDDRECMIGECVTVSMLNWGPVYANIFNIIFFSLTNWVTNTKLVPTKESLNNFTCMVTNKFKPLLFHLAKSLWTRKIW